jgi:hypothetical protein
MHTSLSADSQQLVAEFGRLVEATVGAVPLARRSVDHDALAALQAVHTAVVKGSWHEVSASGTGGAEDVSVLVGMVEAAATVSPPAGYPFVESFMARRVLARVGAEELAQRPGLPVADLAPGLGVDGAPTGCVFPFLPHVDVLVHLAARADGDYDVRVCPPPSDVAPLAQPDALRPLYAVPADRLTHAETVGVLPAAEAAALAAEAVLLQAAEMLGCADALLRRTIEHTSQRQQFGRPLASFQALSHRIVDAYVHVETMRSLVRYASWVADYRPAELLEFAAMAKGYVAENAWAIAVESIQMHGAMGFTWEVGLQHATSRIMAGALAFPSGEQCLALVGRRTLDRGRTPSLLE